MPRIAAGPLQDFVGDTFTAAGCSAEEGARVGKYLVHANLTGHDSHGVQRVPRYIERLQAGEVKINQTVDIVIDLPALAVVDGKFGIGQTVAPQAVAIGIEKCKAGGLAAILLRTPAISVGSATRPRWWPRPDL